MASASITLSLTIEEAELVAKAVDRYLTDVRLESAKGYPSHNANAELRESLESIKEELEQYGFWGD